MIEGGLAALTNCLLRRAGSGGAAVCDHGLGVLAGGVGEALVRAQNQVVESVLPAPGHAAGLGSRSNAPPRPGELAQRAGDRVAPEDGHPTPRFRSEATYTVRSSLVEDGDVRALD